MKSSHNEKSITDLKNWFTGYVKTFQSDDKVFQGNIDIKEEHTYRVCNEILHLAVQLGLNAEEKHLAEIIALFHDIGRFEQYARYKSFNDRQTEDHAVLGIKILQQSGILMQFGDLTRNLILQSIKNHNKPSLPVGETLQCLFFTKLLRDADKLDIWRVVTDNYNRKDGKRNVALELSLPDTPEISAEVYQDLINKRIVDMKYVRNLNDLKLLQAGWIFDINFSPTLECIRTRHYMEMIRAVLPKTKKIIEIFDVIDAVQVINAR